MRKSLVALALALSPITLVASAWSAPLQSVETHAQPRLATGWLNYARDASHNATSPFAAHALQNIHWSTPVDLQPQYFSGELLIHYGTPLITPAGTIVVTVKTGTTGGFQVEGHHRGTGALMWTETTDYILPAHNWTPSCASSLTPSGQLATPGAGGTVYLRSTADSASGTVQQIAFYGIANYQANPTNFNQKVLIDTPITADANGNLFFGFQVVGTSPPLGLSSGLARYSTSTGTGTWIAAHTAANDSNIKKVVYNCAPCLSPDGSSVYVAVNDVSSSGNGAGYLVKLDSTTLAMQARVRLKDPKSGQDATLPDDGTASPTVGPDGDVYFGVLENPFPNNNDRGWMLHFNSMLSTTKIPGAFGWDDTGSIVPASAVPSYAGSSSYLVLTKYNNYAGVGSGNGHNKVAILDPGASMSDPITGVLVMKEVITVLGVTPDPNWAGGVTEWCINTAAVDPVGKCALVNNEDGKLYRWDFVTNTLSQVITLTPGLGEAYTPTLVGPDGVVYAINNATLFAVGN